MGCLGSGSASAPRALHRPQRKKRHYLAPLLLLLLAWLLFDHLFAPLLARLTRVLLVASPRTVLLAQHGTWGSPAELAQELFFVERALQHGAPPGAAKRVLPLPWWLPRAAQLAAADLVLCSVFRPREDTLAAMAAHPSAVWLFVSGENLLGTPWWDHLVGLADVSLGQRGDIDPAAATTTTTAYKQIPWFLPYVLDRSQPGCALPLQLQLQGAAAGRAAAAAWAARPGFALLLSRHANFPRPQLHQAFSALAPVDAPGEAFHSMPWPAHLPNTAAGKQQLLATYRFSLCPENSAFTPPTPQRAQGYTTEKLVQAHLAGAIPIHWGDRLEGQVWNAARVLRLGGEAGGVDEGSAALPNATAELMARVAALEGSAAAREAFFAQPVLQPGAGAWVTAWCAEFGGMLRAALAKKRRQQ